MKRDAKRVLDANKLYAARAVVCLVPTAERCIQASAVTYMGPPSSTDPKVNDLAPLLPSVPDFYHTDEDTEGKWNLLDVPLSEEINVHSSLQCNVTVIRDKYVAYFIEATTTAPGLFN